VNHSLPVALYLRAWYNTLMLARVEHEGAMGTVSIYEATMSNLDGALETLAGSLDGLDIGEACNMEPVVKAALRDHNLTIEQVLAMVKTLDEFVMTLNEYYEPLQG
jgi:hypothetical protein